MVTHHQIIIVGAGPGGLAVAVALRDQGLTDALILDKGEVGQSWLEFPAETHLLSQSTLESDDNMVANIPTSEVFPNMPHPSHDMYQKYLAYVAQQKKLNIKTNTTVENVYYDPHQKVFVLVCPEDCYFTCQFLVWAAGMFSTPNESLDAEGCYIHYSRMPYLEDITSPEVMVIGSANGANGVVLELAKPGRVVTLVTPHNYAVPQPVDTLWKEQMQFVADSAKQGLVKIVENFRVKRIYMENAAEQKGGEEGPYIVESENGQKITAAKKPIVCTGFLPNIKPIAHLVDEVCTDHETFLALDPQHQSQKQPNLYLAGAIGKLSNDQGMIAQFREFGGIIAGNIKEKISKI